MPNTNPNPNFNQQLSLYNWFSLVHTNIDTKQALLAVSLNINLWSAPFRRNMNPNDTGPYSIQKTTYKPDFNLTITNSSLQLVSYNMEDGRLTSFFIFPKA